MKQINEHTTKITMKYLMECIDNVPKSCSSCGKEEPNKRKRKCVHCEGELGYIIGRKNG